MRNFFIGHAAPELGQSVELLNLEMTHCSKAGAYWHCCLPAGAPNRVFTLGNLGT